MFSDKITPLLLLVGLLIGIVLGLLVVPSPVPIGAAYPANLVKNIFFPTDFLVVALMVLTVALLVLVQRMK